MTIWIAGNITPHATRQNYNEEMLFIEPTVSMLFSWFLENRLVAFSGKSKFNISLCEEINFRILNNVIVLSSWEKLVRITINSDLLLISISAPFAPKISKIHCPTKIIEIFNSSWKELLPHSYNMLLWNYCPLVWICRSWTLNNEISKKQNYI